jgi:hypothetical protein
MKDNEILGIVGFVILWKGVAESWTILSDAIVKHKIEFNEKIHEIHNFYEKTLEAHRTHTYVKASNEIAIRWTEKLRYKKEGLLEGFGKNGDDYFMMARTKTNGGIIWQ